MLDENPLPAVLIIQPGSNVENNSESVKKLVTELKGERLVKNVQVDMIWLKRLQAILLVGERLSLTLGVILVFAALLIISNAVGLALNSRSNEVVVIKLIGGTDGYVRRPFLYTGFLYGILGGTLSWIFSAITIYWLSVPVSKLSTLYHSSFKLEGLSLFGLVPLLIIGVSLGLLGALLAVSRQLSTIEPK
jgi:cell division transport system permease protein